MNTGWRAKISWGFYDLANTIFSMNVISLYFPIWIATSFPRGEVWYAVAYSTSMLFVAAVSPFAGSWGDRRGHKPLLLAATTVAVSFTFLLAFGSRLVSLLVLFAVANFGYQVGLVAYNSLLTSVASPEERGKVSGIGVALGYVGSFAGMFAAYPFVHADVAARLPDAVGAVVRALTVVPAAAGDAARQNALVPTAILFALFALPLFFFVRERKGASRPEESTTFASVLATLGEIVKRRELRRFYIATFLYMDAIHTVYIVMGTYAKFAAGLTDGQILVVMSIALGAAVAGSFAYGFIADRVSGRTALMIVLANWIVVLLLAIPVSGFRGFLAVAVTAGIGLGGVEVVARVALLSLIDESERGRFFGFFNFTGKASSIVGPQLWALALFTFEFAGAVRFRVGVALMLVLVVAAVFVLRPVRFPPPARA